MGRSPVYNGVDVDEVRLLMLGLSEVVLLEVAFGVIVLGNNGVGIWLVRFYKASTVKSGKRAREYASAKVTGLKIQTGIWRATIKPETKKKFIA